VETRGHILILGRRAHISVYFGHVLVCIGENGGAESNTDQDYGEESFHTLGA